MQPHVTAEWNHLRHVVIKRPGIEAFYGLLEPYSALFERFFDFSDACAEHDLLAKSLVNHGVKVEYLDEIVVKAAESQSSEFEKLRERAISSIKFRGPSKLTRKAHRRFGENAHLLDKKQLFEITMLKPVVKLTEATTNRILQSETMVRNPPSNLCFMRDQQAVTDRGLVIGRMAKQRRSYEPDLTQFAFEKMGTSPVYRIRPSGTFEGGDFIPAESFALLGCGDRTNDKAVQQLLSHCLGFEEVAVVSQPAHPKLGIVDPMINMHLDTYFNIAGRGIAVGNAEMIQAANVVVYQRRSEGAYAKAGKTSLYSYLNEKRFQLVKLTDLEQMCYASNFLCIRDREIICADVEAIAPSVLENLKNEIPRKPASLRWKYENLHQQVSRTYTDLKSRSEFFPHKPELANLGVSAEKLKLTEITGAYGATHCLTCVLLRD